MGGANDSDDLLLEVLEALIKAWLVSETPDEIGSDVEKIRLMHEIATRVGGEPSELVRRVYEEVFLRDIWNGGGQS